MSGTATSDVFSGDPSKKFDIIFAVDMRQLLSGVGMKSADIDRIMATADRTVATTHATFWVRATLTPSSDARSALSALALMAMPMLV